MPAEPCKIHSRQDRLAIRSSLPARSSPVTYRWNSFRFFKNFAPGIREATASPTANPLYIAERDMVAQQIQDSDRAG